MKFGSRPKRESGYDLGKLLGGRRTALEGALPAGRPYLSRTWHKQHPGAAPVADVAPSPPKEGTRGRRS